MIRHVVLELITPAMIGGAKARECDNPPTLRPPSLRGQLRFWSRALGGDKLEHELWGKEDLGQRVRILAALAESRNWRSARLSDPRPATLLQGTKQHGKTIANMVPPGDRICLRLGIPEDLDLDRLRAVFWVWLHLGTIGRRSRRGYGSVQWLPSEGDLFADSAWPPLWSSRHLKNPASLASYLQDGLSLVLDHFDQPTRKPSEHEGRLVSLEQVFVGKKLNGTWEASGSSRAGDNGRLEQAVHGLNEGARGEEKEHLGSAKPRQASPMMWRCFRCHQGQAFIPVMTWLPAGSIVGTVPRLALTGGVYRYLHGQLGFTKSLADKDLAA